MLFRSLIAAVALLLLLPAQVKAQTVEMPVQVDHSGTDAVGNSLIFAIRERIEGSPLFRQHGQEATYLRIGVSTLDGEEPAEGRWTVYAVFFTLVDGQSGAEFFMGSTVGTCGSQRVSYCANDVFNAFGGRVQGALDTLRRVRPNT